jgi:hypothetical protein
VTRIETTKAKSSKIEMKLYAFAFRTYNDDIPATADGSAHFFRHNRFQSKNGAISNVPVTYGAF